ncbi:unnamed protein product [Adineta ricciae]|uniref:Uracil-DNA glycosylase n=1 Tax=Adineta ricciae TaxID=249248 RepID=A0A814GKP1_ADIRI|nr:unnamed protein product [Adineta ricciae]CAF1130280.1 unnamed protein product [Adineta ricciae]
MAQQKSITFFFRKKREHSDVDENEEVKEVVSTTPKRVKTASNTPVASPMRISQPNSNVNSPNVPKSDEEKRLAERIENNRIGAKMKLEAKATRGLVVDMGISWYKAFEKEFSKEYFQKLASFVADEREKGVTVYPPPHHVFTFTRMCELSEVKVVILGQDPYHGPNQAHGLCFSVRKNVPPPPSLVNMYKELKADIPDFVIPNHGTLSGWARQGVLLLNACLTVEKGKANSHKGKGWEKFTDAIVQYLNDRSANIVFLLWGRDAQNKGARINKSRHHVLTAAHPSPLSAYNGFMGCKHFSKANEYLKSAGLAEINWSNLPSEDEMPFD